MPAVQLSDRALVAVSGPESEAFLQNLVTIDLDSLSAGEARPGALLTPQGKILFDFLVSRDPEDGFLLECRSEIAADFMRRLTLYKLRAKIAISLREQAVVTVVWDDESTPSRAESGSANGGLRDTRFAADVRRFYGEARQADTSETDWRRFRIAGGVAESGADYALGDAFPHDVLLDRNGAIGFRKGCYVGQEVVSRMQHRGTARRRVLIAAGAGPLPAAGTDILSGARAIGTLGSVAGTDGLAIARIDRVKEAIDAGVTLTAGGIPLTLAIPDWAGFGFPEAPASPDAA